MNISFFFALLIGATMLFTIVALFLALPNEVQQRFTKQNRSGYGLLFLGLALLGVSYGFAIGALPHTFGSYELATAAAMLFAAPSGLCLGLGFTIAPPDPITNRILDQKNLWILGTVLVILLGAAFYLLQ